MRQLLIPGMLLWKVRLSWLLFHIMVGMSHVHGSYIGQRQSSFVSGADEATGQHRVVRTHAGAGINQQVAADGARVGYLAFTH